MQIVNPEISAKRRGIVLGLVWGGAHVAIGHSQCHQIVTLQSFTRHG